MRRSLLLASFAALVGSGTVAPAQTPGQCWFGTLSDAEKRDWVQGYARVQQSEGKARATAWAKEQVATFERRAAASGQCPKAAAKPKPRPPARQADGKEPLLNRHGQPCKRIEMENRNVPNIGGSMGWALMAVCRDD